MLEISERIFFDNPAIAIKNKLTTPKEAFNYIKKDTHGKTKEHLFLISMDSRNNAIAKDLISVGTVNETLVHPREIFKQLVLRNASNFILVHNHPSGDANPSVADLELTKNMKSASEIMHINFIDHLIVTDSDYYSIKATDQLI